MVDRGMSRIRVIVADDHPLLREGTRRILDAEDDIAVVGEAADGETAVAMACSLRPDVAIIDIGMPVVNGVEATRRIKSSCPEIAVLILTVHDDDQYLIALIEAGAAGYLLKSVPGTELIRAVRAVEAGETVLSPAMTRKVFDRVRSDRGGAPVHSQHPVLTDRELEVLRLAATGCSNKDIADALSLSARTVQVHLHHVFEKLSVASRTEAVILALRRGLVHLEELG